MILWSLIVDVFIQTSPVHHSPLSLFVSLEHGHTFTLEFFYSQPPALFSVEKSLRNCVKAGHQRTHTHGPPAVSSVSPGLSALSNHSASLPASPTQSLIITPQQTLQDTETASAPQPRGGTAKKWQMCLSKTHGDESKVCANV